MFTAAKRRTGERYIRSSVMYGFAELVRGAGADPVAIAREAGLDPTSLGDPDQLISWQGVATAAELAAARLAMPGFGIAWALAVPSHFPNVGPVALLAAFTETGEDWARLAMQYWRYHTNAYCLQLLAEDGNEDVTFRFWAEAFAFMPRQIMDLMLANTVRMARGVTGIDGDPASVRFQHGRPADTTAYEALFRCRLEFDAEHNEILFARKYLAVPTGGQFRPFKPLLGWYIRSRISQMPIYDQTMKTTVALAIPSVLGTGSCSLDFVARSLGLGSKKLQRLLQEEGTSFSEVLDAVRQRLAMRLIQDSTAPIEHIARLLDYSSSPAFTLAFRRWTGTSPRDYRNLSPRQGRGRLCPPA